MFVVTLVRSLFRLRRPENRTPERLFWTGALMLVIVGCILIIGLTGVIGRTIVRADPLGLETMAFSRRRIASAVVLAALLVLLVPQVAFAAFQPDPERLITEEGVGNAVLAQTAAEMADELGSGYLVGDEIRITVDYRGNVVRQGSVVQFRAVQAGPGDELTLFIVSNPEYTTAEGVGPKTTIAEAESIYGEATLSWNPEDGGREFVTFANGPGEQIMFRTPGIGGVGAMCRWHKLP